MPLPFQTSGSERFIKGYFDDPILAGPNNLSAPSVNADITKTGEATYRRGYIPTSFDLNNAAHASRPFHVPRYNVTFFAINGKVLFVNHNNSDAVVDTGLSLSDTNGRHTRFGEYAGDIYLTNTTDGLRQIHMGLVNDASALSGDSTIVVDQDLAARLLAFSDDTSTIHIANTSPFTETVSSTNANGTITLTGTLNANVADNTVIYTVEDISSGRPFASGITFWKERMVLWGIIYDTAVDSGTNMVYLSSFANLTALENIIDFDDTHTAAHEMIGKNGVITNVLSTRDYLYAFTQNETYYCSTADINQTTGGTPMQLLSNLYGCVNEDCSADLGNGLACFMTNNKRIIGIRISTQTGAPIVFPDEKFDSPISKTVALLDTDQSDSFFFYAPNDHRLYIHCNIDSERIVQKFNTEIQVWEPPTTGWSFGGMYVRGGVTYAAELTDDNVHQLNEGFQDNGIDYEVVMATSLVEDHSIIHGVRYRHSRSTIRLGSVAISGRIGALTTITVENVVSGGTPQQKSFTASGSVSAGALGSVSIGSNTLGSGVGADMEEYDKQFGIYPTYGSTYQLRVRSLANVSGGAFTLSSYTVFAVPMSKPVLTIQ